MAAQSPLRRWKPFFAAFDSVDAAIEAAAPDLCRDELREARGDIVERLCNAMDDDHEAERLCLVLDEVMAESLETLRLVPAMPTVLAKTDLAKAVRALQKHESERVRVLARGIVSRWRAAFENDLVRFRAATKKLDQIPLPGQIVADQQPVSAKILEPSAKKTVKITETPQLQPLHKKTVVDQQLVSADHPGATMKRPAGKILQPSAKNTRKITEMPPPLPKKVSPAVGIARGYRARLCSEDKIMEATKRKLHEDYQEAANAKRQRRIQVVEAPEMLKQRQRKMHPIIKERSRARCGTSMMVKKTISVSKIRRV